MKTFSELQEGVYDPNILKAFFLAGGPGSGKSYVVQRSTGGLGMKIVNSDNAFEKLLKDAGLSLKMPDEEEKPRDVIRDRAKAITKAQQKKAKPANQGGGPNYLGKEKTVTVPKKWLSSPDHVVAELAYITPREQKILLDANLYGSLNGKPNRGPGGIMSLQGDMGSVGGGSSSGNGGDGNTGRERGAETNRRVHVGIPTVSSPLLL